MTSSRAVVGVLCEHDPVFVSFAKAATGTSNPDQVWEALYGRDGISKLSPDPTALAVPGRKLAAAIKPTGIKPKMPKPPGMLKPVKAPAMVKPPAAPKAPTPKPALAPAGMQRTAPAPRRLAPAGPMRKSVEAPQVPKPPAMPRPRVRPARVGGAVLMGTAGLVGTIAAKDKIAEKFRGYKYIKTPPQELAAKSYDATSEFTIIKSDDDKRQVFGWASVIEKDGQPVLDKQGDIIEPDEMEKSAYRFVLESRKGGQQHKRTENDEPLHVSDMIESMAFTKEKIEKMGLPPGIPVGWWVGFKVNDDDTWQDVKNGKVTSFSIHGRGRRVPAE